MGRNESYYKYRLVSVICYKKYINKRNNKKKLLKNKKRYKGANKD
jgi:hypothetical protein